MYVMNDALLFRMVDTYVGYEIRLPNHHTCFPNPLLVIPVGIETEKNLGLFCFSGVVPFEQIG